MKLLGQYSVYSTSITGKTNFWQRIFLGGGMKIPTGVYNKQLTYGITEPHFQPGTGSFDVIMTGLYMAKLEKVGLGWRNDVVYVVTTANKNDYRFANRFNWASTFSYDITTKSVTVLPHSGIYLETANPDKYQGQDAEGSGGTVLFATFGLDAFYDLFSLDLDWQLPISENFIDEQPENKFRLYVALGYSF
jgi:hypothetical protein